VGVTALQGGRVMALIWRAIETLYKVRYMYSGERLLGCFCGLGFLLLLVLEWLPNTTNYKTEGSPVQITPAYAIFEEGSNHFHDDEYFKWMHLDNVNYF
jgi:hypothetical protein